MTHWNEKMQTAVGIRTRNEKTDVFYLGMIMNEAVFADVDVMLEAKQIGHPFTCALAQTHFCSCSLLRGYNSTFKNVSTEKLLG